MDDFDDYLEQIALKEKQKRKEQRKKEKAKRKKSKKKHKKEGKKKAKDKLDDSWMQSEEKVRCNTNLGAIQIKMGKREIQERAERSKKKMENDRKISDKDFHSKVRLNLENLNNGKCISTSILDKVKNKNFNNNSKIVVNKKKRIVKKDVVVPRVKEKAVLIKNIKNEKDKKIKRMQKYYRRWEKNVELQKQPFDKYFEQILFSKSQVKIEKTKIYTEEPRLIKEPTLSIEKCPKESKKVLKQEKVKVNVKKTKPEIKWYEYSPEPKKKKT